MNIAKKYSHMNGEEYLIVHHSNLYDEIIDVIMSIDASLYKTKVCKEKGKIDRLLYSPKQMNEAFNNRMRPLNWKDTTYEYYITLNRELIEKCVDLGLDEQKKILVESGDTELLRGWNQTDFVKDKVAVEVQFGKYAFVAYDLFVKHMLFYSGSVINLGIEILPTKVLQLQMSSGPGCFEKEVYNIMRQGRSSPPVPLLILGIEP